VPRHLLHHSSGEALQGSDKLVLLAGPRAGCAGDASASRHRLLLLSLLTEAGEKTLSPPQRQEQHPPQLLPSPAAGPQAPSTALAHRCSRAERASPAPKLHDRNFYE